MSAVTAAARCWACGDPAAPLASYGPQWCVCRSCGLAFQPGRRPEELRALYDRAYFAGKDIDVTTRIDRASEARVRVDLVRSHAPGRRLLEIGAGAGHFLAEATAAGYQAVGIEPSREIAAEGRARLGVSIREGTLEAADLETGAYDVACAWHVLEHVPDPLPALVEVRRALVPGGALLLEVPNFASVRSRREGPRWALLEPDYHVSQFGPHSLRALLARAGFTGVRVWSIPFATYKRGPRVALSYAKHALLLRGSPFGSDPTRHELLRALARAPARPASGPR